MDDFLKNKLKGFALIEVLIALTVVAVFCSVTLSIGRAVFNRVHIMTDKMKMSLLVCNIREHANACEGMRDLISCVEALAQSDKIFDDLEAWQSPKRKGGVQKRKVLGSDGYFASDLRKSDFDYILVQKTAMLRYPSATPAVYCRTGNGQKTVFTVPKAG